MRNVHNKEGDGTTVYALLIGIGQHLQHYSGFRKAPNARIVFKASEGFNRSSLALVSDTPNGVGVRANRSIVVNFGVDFVDQGSPSKKVTGPLDHIWQKYEQAQDVSGSQEDDAQKATAKQQAEEAAKKAAATQAAEETKKKEAEQKKAADVAKKEEAQKKKAEEVALKKEEAAKKKAEEAKKTTEGDATKKRIADGAKEEGEAAKRARGEQAEAEVAAAEVVAEVTIGLNKYTLALAGEKLLLSSSSDGNKKIPKDTLVVEWGDGAWRHAPPSAAEAPLYVTWDVNLATLVYSKAHQALLPLKKLIKEKPMCTSVMGYEPWPLGGGPGAALRASKSHFVLPADKHMPAIMKAVVGKTAVVGAWVMGYDEKKRTLKPEGWALVAAKQVIVAAGAPREVS